MNVNYRLLSLILINLIFVFQIRAQELPVELKLSIVDQSDNPVSNTFVKVSTPEFPQGVDSALTNENGLLDIQLPFTFGSDPLSTEPLTGKEVISQHLAPNILSTESNLTITYHYPEKATLFFMDIQGRILNNHQTFSPGIYFYYLEFEDGYKSEARKIIVQENIFMAVRLISEYNETLQTGSNQSYLKSAAATDVFYLYVQKDGYIPETDTITVEAVEITQSYALTAADKPTAAFEITGEQTVGKPVVFNGTSSSGSENEALIYSWDFDNGKKGQSAMLPHVFNTPGNYDVTLTVSGDYGGTNSITKSITIDEKPGTFPNTGILTGYISDLADQRLSGVAVTLVEAPAIAQSGIDGMVVMPNVPVGKPLHLKLAKEGYANQTVEITIPTDTEEAHFYASLKPRNAGIRIADAELGGEALGAEGATVNLPVAGLTKSDGSLARGNIDVFITPVDVPFETASFPGSFNAFRSNGDDGLLLSYGVSEFVFKQGDNELQLAPGKTATITIPIYTSGAVEGEKIDLWSINEDNGTWIQEGTGTVVLSPSSPTGLALEATVGHFSWWNCDDFANSKPRTGLCWETDCSTGFCVKKAVGCWVSGARDGTNLKSSTREEIQPVFEVREYLPNNGKSLLMPTNTDILIHARGFSETGELLTGNYFAAGDDNASTFEIELFSSSAGDTIELALNDTLDFFLEDEIVHFKISLPEPALYDVMVKKGNFPSLSGIFTVRDEYGKIVSDDISQNNQRTYAQDYLLISVSGYNSTDEGNITISVSKTKEPIPIELNDSIYETISAPNDYQVYSFSSPKNTTFTASVYRALGNLTGNVQLLNPKGNVVDQEYLGSNRKTLATQITKDSTYYLYFQGNNNTGDFVIITEEDLNLSASFGDTLTPSLIYEKDIDLIEFSGNKDDFVIIKNKLPYSSALKTAEISLLTATGSLISRGSIGYQESQIQAFLPQDAQYFIKVENQTTTDTGSYQIILAMDTITEIEYNAVSAINIESDKEYYFQVNIPESASLSTISLFSNTNNGEYDFYNEASEKLFNTKSFRSTFNNAYSADFPEGRYIIKVSNNNADTVYLNVWNATPLVKNNKNLASLTDTIYEKNEIKVYSFTGSPGDGIHAILNTVSDVLTNQEAEVHFYRQSAPPGIEITFNNNRKRNLSYTLDTTRLYEVAGELNGSINDTWTMIVHGENVDIFQLDFHHLLSRKNIMVDDNFTEYPEAVTSSLLAAGYALQDGGSIEVANGEYLSYLVMTINRDMITFTGQEKDQVLIQNILNSSAVSFNSQGGTLSDVSLSTNEDAFTGLSLGRSNITVENIYIKPGKDQNKVGGKIQGSRDGTVIKNVTILNSSVEGIDLSGDDILIENCSLITDRLAIEAVGNNITVKNNDITVHDYPQAIRLGALFGDGQHRVDSNNIEMTSTTLSSSNGIILINENGDENDTNESFVRHNTIVTQGGSHGIYAAVGNPPSTVTIEHNKYTCTNPAGGLALQIVAGRSLGGNSDIIVRNNIFEGLSSYRSIKIYHADMLSEGRRFSVINNSFRLASGTDLNTDYYMVDLANQSTTFTDTSSLYLVNNIFVGNGQSYFLNFRSDYSIYSDYNVIHNFGLDKNDLGIIIGGNNNISQDPLFIDDDLHLDAASPAIDSGASPADYLNIPALDFNGTARPQGSGYDIGAWEEQ